MPHPPIVLASASPRRRELLAALDLPFEVHPSHVDETTDERDPVQVARLLAARKAKAVLAGRPGATVIGSDTIVVLDGELLGKPARAEDARGMLRALRGRSHEVITGVAVALDGQVLVDHGRTAVHMRAYADDEIDAFVATGSPFDKAGGYAIQDESFAPVARFEGCRCNVIGLPLSSLRGLLDALDIRTADPDVDCPVCRIDPT